jgi:hypothetical protein
MDWGLARDYAARDVDLVYVRFQSMRTVVGEASE